MATQRERRDRLAPPGAFRLKDVRASRNVSKKFGWAGSSRGGASGEPLVGDRVPREHPA